MADLYLLWLVLCSVAGSVFFSILAYIQASQANHEPFSTSKFLLSILWAVPAVFTSGALLTQLQQIGPAVSVAGLVAAFLIGMGFNAGGVKVLGIAATNRPPAK